MIRIILINIVIAFLMMSCDNGPKVIKTPVNGGAKSETSTGTGVFSGMTADTLAPKSNPSMPGVAGVHTVVVEEVLPTEKYVYLRVKEGTDEFWVATGKQEVEVGQTYFYKDGLLKTNFVSKEYNRTFDKVYLVGKIVPANHAGGGMNESAIPKVAGAGTPVAGTGKIVRKEGSMKIADLVANPKKYEGKVVQITGKCTKLNANIMGRNWMHLQDGSKDDYDLVVTSDVAVPEGHVVTMKAKVALNIDFGAGYKYDIILQEGEIVK